LSTACLSSIMRQLSRRVSFFWYIDLSDTIVDHQRVRYFADVSLTVMEPAMVSTRLMRLAPIERLWFRCKLISSVAKPLLRHCFITALFHHCFVSSLLCWDVVVTAVFADAVVLCNVEASVQAALKLR
jgi:hypothetical protein